jgi:hypothetical protein
MSAKDIVDSLEEGKTYHVVYRHQGGNYQWYEKQFVARYLGRNLTQWNQLQWSFRPVAGTSEIDAVNIIAVNETQSDVYAPRPFRG